MNSAAALAGLRVLVTRPPREAQALAARIEAQGGTAQLLPLQCIVEAGDPAARAALAARLCRAEDDWWIFTSRNAVEQAATLCPPPWTNPPRLAAVGAATAAALRACSDAPVLTPEAGFSGAALLALPPLQDLRGRQVCLLTGADSRPELPASLSARGARLEVLELYRRQVINHPQARVEQALQAVDAVLVANGEALARLVAITPPALRQRLLGLALAVPSSRVVEQAIELGFQLPPLVPDAVSDAAYVQCLARWWSERPAS